LRKKNRPVAPELPATTHYIFKCSEGNQALLTRPPLLAPPLDNWMGGERWGVNVPKDLVFEIDEDDEGAMLPFFEDVIPLMRTDLIAELRAAGVDNIDDYPAIVRETRTGREYDDYRAVNIIGAVRGADVSRSDIDPSSFDGELLIDAVFRRLVLDESAIEGLLLFRLAENVSIILIHQDVRDHLTRTGIESLSFIHPAEWGG